MVDVQEFRTMPREEKQPDPTGINIIVVGYEQEVKVKLLNALCRDEEAFKQFECRTKPSVKNVRTGTISGRQIIVVQTSSLNSPAWVSMREDFLTSWKSLTCVFLYLTTPHSRDNDVGSIKSLQRLFGEKQVRSVLCYEKHNRKHIYTESIDQTFQFKFQHDTDFETQVSAARTILEKLKDIATVPEMHSITTGHSEVGSEKTESRPSTSPGDESVVKCATELAATVLVPDIEYIPRMKEKLTQEDWNEFQHALRHGKARSNHVRVNVVGNHGVGKTTLINRILMKNVRCPEPNPTPTENLEVHRVTIRCEERNGKKVWEKEEHESYVDELNIQRMAQALIQSRETPLFKDSKDTDNPILSPQSYSLQQEEDTSSGGNISTPVSGDTPVTGKTQMIGDTPVSGDTIVSGDTPVSDDTSLKLKTTDDYTKPGTGIVKPKFYLDNESNQSDLVTTTEQSLSQQSSSDEDIGRGSEELTESDSLSSSHPTTNFFSPISTQSFRSLLSHKDEYLRKVIYCKDLLEKNDNEKIYVSFWDYAGQSTYYATHHLFMSPSAVYLLVIDLRKELNEKVTDNLEFRSGVLQECTVADALTFWVSSIQAQTQDEHGGNAPIIIVGTHREEIMDRDKVARKFKDIRKLISKFHTNAECIAIDNKLDPEKEESFTMLKDKIIDVGLGIIDEKVTAQWINLEYDMQRRGVCSKGYMMLSELRRLDKKMDVPICDDIRLEAFLCHQHCRGHLLFFQNPELKNLIVTNPIIMIEFLNLLFRKPDLGSSRHRKGWNEDGVLNQEYVIETADKILQIETFAYHILLKILVQLHILYPIPSETADCKKDQYFVPCLLPDKDTPDTSDKDKCSKSSLFQIKFEPDRIHQTTFHQIVCALLKDMTICKSGDKKEIYNLHVIFEIGDSLALLFLSWDKHRLVFFVENFSKRGTETLNKYVDEARELIEHAIESVLRVNGNEYVDFSFHVQCPEHSQIFLPLKQLQEKGEVRCDGEGTGRHSVDIGEINGIVEMKTTNQPSDPILEEQPTDNHLARLALKIEALNQGENAVSLAVRLKMQGAMAEADIATRDLPYLAEKFIHLLVTWRNSKRKDRTIYHLLKLVTKRKDYDFTTLKDAILTSVKSDIEIDSIPPLVSEQNRDLRVFSNRLGPRYAFALIELGISWSRIEEERSNHPRTKEAIFQLLLQWRRINQNTSTVKKILEAAKMVGVATDEIIKQLWEGW